MRTRHTSLEELFVAPSTGNGHLAPRMRMLGLWTLWSLDLSSLCLWNLCSPCLPACLVASHVMLSHLHICACGIMEDHQRRSAQAAMDAPQTDGNAGRGDEGAVDPAASQGLGLHEFVNLILPLLDRNTTLRCRVLCK